jgi:cytochrome P450
VIARGVPTFEDPEAGVAQAGAFLSPLTSGTASMLVHALADLVVWFGAHPDDARRWAHPAFLEGAITETIRLHQPVVIPRLARKDLALPSGRTIRRGQYVAITRLETNRDPSVFGADADSYDPRRTVPPGVYPFGLGFGSGPHMCVALPLVLGQGGISGLLAPVLRALFSVGVKPDPGQPARKVGHGFPFREVYVSYPVTFDRVRTLPAAAIAET